MVRTDMTRIKLWLAFPALLICLSGNAEDWPQEGCDAGRTNHSNEELAPDLHLQWQRDFPALKLASPDTPGLRYGSRIINDHYYHPIVIDSILYIASPVDYTLRALDTKTGKTLWTWYAEGPIRLAPAGKKDAQGDVLIYVASDDGYLYCINGKSGSLKWKYQGAFSHRKIIGQNHLISTWPARGAPVVKDNRVYFGVGVYSFMGSSIYCLDAESGNKVWSSDHSTLHRGEWMANGLEPIGHLLFFNQKLMIPVGQVYPGFLKSGTGDFVNFATSGGVNLRGEASAVCRALEDCYFTGGLMVHEKSKSSASLFAHAVSEDVVLGNPITPEGIPHWRKFVDRNPNVLVAWDIKNGKTIMEFSKEKGEKEVETFSMPEIWRVPLDQGCDVAIQTKTSIYAHNGQEVLAIDADSGETRWSYRVSSRPENIITADKRLFVITRAGSLYCFGPEKSEATTTQTSEATEPGEPGVAPVNGRWKEVATMVSESVQNRGEDGYGIVLNIGSGKLLDALIQSTKHKLWVIDSDKQLINSYRTKYDHAGLLGRRISFFEGEFSDIKMPPYVAQFIISETDIPVEESEILYRSLHPYGGKIYHPVSSNESVSLRVALDKLSLHHGKTIVFDGYVALERHGPPKGARDYTHQNANAANTSNNDDALKPPLGILWMGGDVHLTTFYMTKQPLVANGRFFIQGTETKSATTSKVNAYDVYTGTPLWKKKLDLEIASEEYFFDGKSRYNAKSGEKELEYPYSFTKTARGKLVGTSEAVDLPKPYQNVDKVLNVMDVNTGKLIWQHQAQNGVLGFVLGKDKLFYYDAFPSRYLEKMGRRGAAVEQKTSLVALDFANGKVLWKREIDPLAAVFDEKLGSLVRHTHANFSPPDDDGLCYSEQHDVLIASDSVYRIFAFQGTTGKKIWDRVVMPDPVTTLKYDRSNKYNYMAPFILNDTSIYTQHREVFDLLTGAKKQVKNPVTGETLAYELGLGGKSCDKNMGSKNLIYSRHWTSAYENINERVGSTYLCSVRSSCKQATFIVAGGVMNMPDTGGGCSCTSFPMASSVAMIEMPENEYWSIANFNASQGPMQKCGINFGAPGDRLDEGVLWYRYPQIPVRIPAIKSFDPQLPVKSVASHPRYFYRNALRLTEGSKKWVGASGIEGLKELSIEVDKPNSPEKTFRLQLYFAEPEDLKPGKRVFNIFVQNEKVIEELNIVEKANGVNRVLVETISNVKATDMIHLKLEALQGRTLLCGVSVEKL